MLQGRVRGGTNFIVGAIRLMSSSSREIGGDSNTSRQQREARTSYQDSREIGKSKDRNEWVGQSSKSVGGFEEAGTDGITESSSQRGSDGIPGNCKVGD